MTTRVHFIVDAADGEEREKWELTDVPIPPEGSDVTVDDRKFQVRKVTHAYWVASPENVTVVVSLKAVEDSDYDSF
jgi:hypothetical protein